MNIEDARALFVYAEDMQKELLEVLSLPEQYKPELAAVFSEAHPDAYGDICQMARSFRFRVNDGVLDFELSIYVTQGYISLRSNIWQRDFNSDGRMISGRALDINSSQIYYYEHPGYEQTTREEIKKFLIELAYQITYTFEGGTPQELYDSIKQGSDTDS